MDDVHLTLTCPWMKWCRFSVKCSLSLAVNNPPETFIGCILVTNVTSGCNKTIIIYLRIFLDYHVKWVEKIFNVTACKCDLPFRCWYTTLVLQEALIWEKYSLHPVYHLLCSWKQLFLYHHGWPLLDCHDCISRLVWNREGRAPMRSKNIRTKIVNCIYFQSIDFKCFSSY